MMDEDVFLDEAILAEDEAALLMVQRDEALAPASRGGSGPHSPPTWSPAAPEASVRTIPLTSSIL
jgi:hypothetical protein